jgi:hypothetical protein
MADTIYWVGKSGAKYKYEVFKLNTTFKKKPGNYVFAKETEPGRFKPLYVGQTGDLSSRFTNHHAEDCLDRNGVTHITVHVNEAGDQARLDEETDIRNHYDPACNKQ